jgi:hypothetical protein
VSVIQASFPSAQAVAPMNPMMVPRAITSAPVVPAPVPAKVASSSPCASVPRTAVQMLATAHRALTGSSSAARVRRGEVEVDVDVPRAHVFGRGRGHGGARGGLAPDRAIATGFRCPRLEKLRAADRAAVAVVIIDFVRVSLRQPIGIGFKAVPGTPAVV